MTHAKKFLTDGMKKHLQTFCGDFNYGRHRKEDEVREDGVTRVVVTDPGEPSDSIIDPISLEKRKTIDCPKCLEMLPP